MFVQNMNEAIRRLNENTPHGLEFVFRINEGLPSVMLIWYCENGYFLLQFEQELRYVEEWNRLGAAIGRSSSLHTLTLRGIVHRHNNSNNESDQCMEAIYRGIEMNNSIKMLYIDMDFFPDEETFPTLNLNSVQFKSSLKHFIVRGSINEDQSHIISSFLEDVTLESFNMANVWDSSESSFRRVVLACTKVENFRVCCGSASQYAVVASLLGNPRSILSEISFCQKFEDAEGLATIAAGLASNTTLQILSFRGYCRVDLSPITETLCDASSIEGIRVSNHTLQEVSIRHSGPVPALPEMMKACLELNKNANKDEVIRKKIARYYFIGKFDISPFANMPVFLLAELLSLIEGKNINMQSAIFRMLKCIPVLCNVSSRDARHGNGDQGDGSGSNKKYVGDKEGSGSPSNKRPKIND